MNRREFSLISILLCIPYTSGINNRNFQLLLEDIKSPFKLMSEIDDSRLDAWIKELPVNSDLNTLTEYLVNLIRQDYKKNDVSLVEGIILSNTEIKLYSAKELYV